MAEYTQIHLLNRQTSRVPHHFGMNKIRNNIYLHVHEVLVLYVYDVLINSFFLHLRCDKFHFFTLHALKFILPFPSSRLTNVLIGIVIKIINHLN